MKVLVFDFETASLSQQAPVTALCWLVADTETGEVIEKDLTSVNQFQADYDAADRVVAHNLLFDINFAIRHLKISISTDLLKHYCTMSAAKYYRLKSASLNNVAKSLGLGAKLQISSFVQNDLFGNTVAEYCAQDVRLTYDIYKAMPLIPEHEIKIYNASLLANARGIPFDKGIVKALIRKIALRDKYNFETLVDLGVSPTAKAIKAYILRTYGVSTNNKLTRDSNSQIAEDRIVKLWNETRRPTLKKLQTILSYADDSIKYQFVYYGATTGRWTSKGIQAQNLPRTKLKDLTNLDADAFDEHLKQLDISSNFNENYYVRLAITKPGHKVVKADYSQIEARCMSFLCSDPRRLAIFRNKQDLYSMLATHMFNIALEDVKPEQRRKAKAAELAFGYGGRFKSYCGINGMDPDTMSDAETLEVKELIKLWLNANQHIVSETNKIFDAFTRAMVTKASYNTAFGTIVFEPAFYKNGKLALIKVIKPVITKLFNKQEPSILYYRDVHISKGQIMANGVFLSPGKLLENLSQSLARDIKASALVRCVQLGYIPFMMLHDELGFVLPENTVSEAIPKIQEAMEGASFFEGDFPVEIEVHSRYC